MTAKKLLSLLLLICVGAGPASLAQQPASSPDDGAPLLRLDDALSIAFENNRLVRNSSLEAQKFDFRVSTSRSRRLPQFQVDVLSGGLLQPFDFTIPAGSLGNFATTGPIPAADAKITTHAQFTTFATGSIDQPLSQQFKIHYGIRVAELGREIALEQVRGQRQKIAAQVRAAYYNLVSAQAAVQATREEVKTLEEAQRVTARYRLQEAVLRADVLDVDARLAKSRYQLSVTENGLSTEREHLNELLGRDLATPFRVEAMPEDDSSDLTLEAARHNAAENRPEIREARLKETQAQYDRRIAKAEYIPDISLSVRYMGFNNFQVLPGNVATAGVYFSWEPFDWGRRHNNVAEKSKTVEQARLGAKEAQAQVALEVGTKYRKWQESVLLLKAARTAHEAAAEQFRVTSNRYKEQATLVKDVLQAQARSAEAGSQYQQALSTYWSSLADLRRAMGEE
ncbi:MAG TPA: TolC family protein [Candidatus Limnocylindrales bacterium]|nr:TolC family protein [Candidatus Limnocylindrales bacterium]